MELKKLRKENNLTQVEAARLVGIPYRTYIRYEENPSYHNSYKYKMFYDALSNATKIDEEHGILTIEQIRKQLIPILDKHRISYCYLFGSYAKGCPKEKSDIDLLVDTDLTGFDFYGLVEEMRTKLKKKIDLLRVKDLQDSNPIILEILKEGIRIL